MYSSLHQSSCILKKSSMSGSQCNKKKPSHECRDGVFTHMREPISPRKVSPWSFSIAIFSLYSTRQVLNVKSRCLIGNLESALGIKSHGDAYQRFRHKSLFVAAVNVHCRQWSIRKAFVCEEVAKCKTITKRKAANFSALVPSAVSSSSWWCRSCKANTDVLDRNLLYKIYTYS